MELKTLLEKMIKVNASDLHLKAGSTPVFRIDGKLAAEKGESLTPETLKTMAYQIMTPSKQEAFERMKEMDFAIGVRGIGRFRVNIFLQRGSIAIAMRAIPISIKRIEELNLPLVIKDLSLKPRGLIFCTGTTGSGKSTTLAAMIEHINENTSRHIITIEDPIEYLFRDNLSIICQREVIMDTISFSIALKHILRQDPDVILIGEMRDLETIGLAITAAETGHLVITTLHTADTISTIHRIIDVFPPHQQNQIRMQLSLNLLCIISQDLLKRTDGNGRIAAYEILIAIPSVRNLIREAKIHQISSILQTSQQLGMISFDACLANMVKKQIITKEEAESKALNPDTFHKEMEQISKSE